MSAPVTISPTTPTSPAPTAGGSSIGINSLLAGNSLFGSLLTNKAANADAPEPSSFKIGGGTLMMFSQDGADISLDSLKSLLDTLGDTSGELNTKILIAMTPGTPAQDILDNLQAKLTELGIDPSTVTTVFVQPSATTPPTLPSTPVVATATVAAPTTLTVDVATADDAENFLLVTTGLAPSEMESLKDAIKALVNEDGKTIAVPSTKKDTSTDLTTTESPLVLMVFVTPPPKQIEPAKSDEISFDLSALSAFTQPSGSDSEEPDWTKKLSDKLSSMTLTKDVSPFDTETSPFDDEMNSILSFSEPKKSELGFQGSLSKTADAKADASATKSVTGEVSAQALAALNHAGALPMAAMHHLNGDAMIMANGNMLTAQNMSSLTNPIFTSVSASSAHPSVQAVAVMIEKAASGSEKAKQELSVQLDPPELGRMQVQLSMEKDGVMKVHLLTEKQETLSLFQRDSHALKSALENAGIQVDSNSLTFDLASGDQSFNQLMGNSQDNQSGNGQSRSMIGINVAMLDTGDANILESKMNFVADKITGNVHYSFWA